MKKINTIYIEMLYTFIFSFSMPLAAMESERRSSIIHIEKKENSVALSIKSVYQSNRPSESPLLEDFDAILILSDTYMIYAYNRDNDYQFFVDTRIKSHGSTEIDGHAYLTYLVLFDFYTNQIMPGHSHKNRELFEDKSSITTSQDSDSISVSTESTTYKKKKSCRCAIL